ncbi:MAG: hypothetical protein MPL62_10320 [Alphaproteobacteria bacterium]|nr:hypothetical protein [Alphaproteobacteria bacterium]
MLVEQGFPGLRIRVSDQSRMGRRLVCRRCAGVLAALPHGSPCAEKPQKARDPAGAVGGDGLYDAHGRFLAVCGYYTPVRAPAQVPAAGVTTSPF